MKKNLVFYFKIPGKIENFLMYLVSQLLKPNITWDVLWIQKGILILK